MAGGYNAPQDGLEALRTMVRGIRERLSELERPSGTSLSSLVQQVQQALADIDAKVTASINANSYDKGTIDAKDAASVSSANAFTQAGFSASGGISAPDLFTRNGPGFDITGTRVASWLQSVDGRIGTASSSERFKRDIETVGLDHLRGVLGIDVVHFSYIDEVRKRDDPTFEGYVGPDYHVSVNIGVIAERLHEAGLWEFVVYEHEPVIEQQLDPDGELVDVVVGERLKLDADGSPVPHGVHDILLAYSLIPIVADHDRRLAVIEEQLGIDSASA